MKQCKNNVNYFEMTIVDRHREYQLPKHPHVHIRTRWDGDNAQTIIDYFIDECCPDYPMSKSDYQHVSDEHLMAVMKRKCFTHPNILPDPYEPISIDDVSATLYRITGDLGDLHAWAELYAIEIKRECQNVGGDDGFYDYFPTYLYMFYCVCRELNLRDLYDKTMKYVLHDSTSQYYETDDAVENMWTE